MSRRTRASTPSARVTTVHIPQQRGRRQDAPFVVVVPERPSLLARAAAAVGWWLWRTRRSWVPTGAAVLLLPFTGVVHLMAPHAGSVLAVVAALPVLWLAAASRKRPAPGKSVLRWRVTITAVITALTGWTALAVFYGPFAGPLPWLWLLVAGAAQGAWSLLRRPSSRPATSEEAH
ncbi:hypothetical protein [Streptomyces roseoverticillatus]|uniref:hypothetical protein n=1 Tax=Streptomyces roseoverticillatus TaxID=66429 RepID=UPI0004C1BC3D|nr:hypothetical protein [Streptomyces roseoverticillatus]